MYPGQHLDTPVDYESIMALGASNGFRRYGGNGLNHLYGGYRRYFLDFTHKNPRQVCSMP
jgi:hypothetical protein